MKKIIFLTALISSSIVFFAFKNDKHTPIFDASLVINKVDSFPNSASVSNASTKYTVNGFLTAGVGTGEKNYTDTFAANLTSLKDYSGSHFWAKDTFWIRNVSVTKWIALLANTKPLPFNDSIYVKPPLYVIVDSLGRRIIAIHMQDGLVSGGIVTWSGRGLIFNISPAIYVIGGVQYSSPATRDTLSPANGSNPRYDLFVVDTSNHAGHITGTAAPSPTVPQPEIGFQLALTNGLIINPGDTIPSNIQTTVIYDQNVEWSNGAQHGNYIVNFNNTDNPYHLTKAIYLSKYQNTSLFFIDNATHYQNNTGGTLDFWIYLNGAYKGVLYASFIEGSSGYAAVSYTISSNDGFNKNDSNEYQHITIPYSKISWLKPQFNQVQLFFNGTDTSGAKGVYVDLIRLQSGIPNIQPSGNYADSAGTYRINDSTFVTKTCKNGICTVVGDTIHIHSTSGSGGTGTVTSIATGYGLSGGTITTTGTIVVDSAALSLKYLRIADSLAMLSPYKKSYVSIDSVPAHTNWTLFKKMDGSTPDTQKILIPKSLVTAAKNATRDSVIYTFSDGSTQAVKDSTGGGGGGSALSSITAAVTTNTIDNGALNKQEWQWNTLDTTTAFKISANTTGTSTGGPNPKLFEVALSGANAASSKTTFAEYISNKHTGTSSTNVGLYCEASGGSTNTAGVFVGSVLIGGTSAQFIPSATLDVRGSGVLTNSISTNNITPYNAGAGPVAVTSTNGLTSSGTISVVNYGAGLQFNYTRQGAAFGYGINGNNILSAASDTSILQINNNSAITKSSLYSKQFQISDTSAIPYNWTYNPNAVFDVRSTTRGSLPAPRVTTTQMNAIVLTGAAYGIIATTPGGYTNGIYIVSLSGGSGTGATAKIVVSANVVLNVFIINPGSGYVINDVLTASLPAGSGFTYTLTALTGVDGLEVYNITTHRTYKCNGTSWVYSPITSTGTAAPSTTPLAVGDEFVDTNNKKIYFATGTSSSSDWTITN